jgi:hypothetical protein
VSYVDNSTMRACDGPGCAEAYDAMTGPTGHDTPTPWRLHKTFGLHMCPGHAAAFWGPGDGPHVPHLENRETTTAACSCGHVLPGPTLGDMRTSYLDHLGAQREGKPSCGS